MVRKAAEQGLLWRKPEYGALYALGRGVEQNDGFAYLFFNLAAANGDMDAIKFQDNDYKDKLSPEVIEAAQQFVSQCKAKGFFGIL